MVFSSALFVFVFLPVVILAYFAVPKRFLSARNIVLLLASLFFYFYGEPKYIIVMLFSISVNYAFGYMIFQTKENERGSKWLLALCVIINIAVLVYFKYLTFIIENVNTVFGSGIPELKIIMPIGISFFTFQAMSYVFDVYYGTAPAQKNPLNVALYISLFPQLIAGPIVRYETIASEIGERFTDADKFAQGVTRFVYGFAKKIIIANSMGLMADQVFAKDASSLSAPLAWLGALAYAFQIYYDFSGYSDMAIGLGKIFGFDFLENFDYPYISVSITDFWRRWHISLSTWFRDYVYIPLGGNRAGAIRRTFNILAVWLLTGIWHGAAWNFVVWGLYFAVILILEKAYILRLLSKCGKVIPHIYALILITVGWVIFRSDNLAYAAKYIQRMFDVSAAGFSGQAYYYILEYRAEWLIAILFSMPVGRAAASVFSKADGKASEVLYYILKLLFMLIVFALSILYLVNSTFNPFIYFRF